jgi:hypothetical protein
MTKIEELEKAYREWRKWENRNTGQYHWDFVTKESRREREVFEMGYLAGQKSEKSNQNNPIEEKS